VTDRQASN